MDSFTSLTLLRLPQDPSSHMMDTKKNDFLNVQFEHVQSIEFIQNSTERVHISDWHPVHQGCVEAVHCVSPRDKCGYILLL